MCEKADLGNQVLPLLNHIKHLFQSHSQFCIGTVIALTKDLHQEGPISEIVAFLVNLINTEHNAKKKIVYVKMLEGVISSMKNLPSKAQNALT